MRNATNSHANTRLGLLWATMPAARRRHTAREGMIVCRHLTEHLRRARQLLAYAKIGADCEAVGELVAEIELRRDELSENGQLARRAREERARPGPPSWLRELRALVRLLEAESRRSGKNVAG